MMKPLSDDLLRHGLWCHLVNSLAVPNIPPLSNVSARGAGTALTVRAAERLSPGAVRASKAEDPSSSDDEQAWCA